jgi:acetyl esterase/lipase
LITIPYGPAPQQYAELRLPPGDGPFPVVVVIHGGCWVEYASAQYTTPLATALAEHGFATWNLEYRRAHEEGGGWPGTFLDVGRGVDALRDAAEKYSLNLQKLVVMGHSAGGQLALWTAARWRLPLNSELHTDDPLQVRGAVSLAGIIDMRAYLEGGLARCAAGEMRVMGGDCREYPERYAQVSPAELLPLGVPQFLVWGEQDEIVPEELFPDYEQRARESGDQLHVIRMANAGHHEVCSTDEPGFGQIVRALHVLMSSGSKAKSQRSLQ